MKRLIYILLLSVLSQITYAQTPGYLDDIKTELQKTWPKNRTINLVFHGHSVPSGYFKTPEVHTLEAYPYQVLQQLKKIFPYAVINVITTSIGGENSVQGAKRFKKEVLTHHPDVVFIDYALNDRAIGLQKSKKAMEKMIRMAQRKNVKIILLTPSPDTRVDITNDNNELEQFASQLVALSEQYHTGLVNSYRRFKELVRQGNNINEYMAQVNHPNEKGHRIIADAIMNYFK